MPSSSSCRPTSCCEPVRCGAGLVVNEHSQPAAGVEVERVSGTSMRRGGGLGPHRLVVRTGPDGRFVVPGVPETADVELSA